MEIGAISNWRSRMQNGIFPVVIWFVTILLCLFVFAKVINYKITGVFSCIRGIALSIILAFVIVILRDIVPFLRFVFMILMISVFLGITTKTQITLALTGAIISIGISYGLLLVSSFISTTFVFFAFGDQQLILEAVISVVLQAISVICLFRVKRFSKGIPFLRKRAAGVIGCLLSGAIMITFIIANRGISAETGVWAIAGTVLCAIGLIYWWRRGLTKQYRERVKERNIQELERIVNEKEARINKLQEDNEMMARIIHRDNKLLPALVENVLLYMRSDKNTESNGNQLLEQAEQLIKERTGILKRELNESIVKESQMNPIIDGVIRHMMIRASAEGIQFEIAELSNFSVLIESIIQPIKLQTLLADLVENAINATEDSRAGHILISLCENNGIYELSVHDRGVCFDAETLASLGKRKTTTRTREGGSGIGYMEIFKILNEYNASLTITEYEPEQSYFTKSVSIRFDKKAEYILHTYRAEAIMGFCPDEDSMPLLKIMSGKVC
jgi:signal transduction histidine kinase